MEVALLVSDDAGMRCSGIKVIDECSLEEFGVDFLSPTASLLW